MNSMNNGGPPMSESTPPQSRHRAPQYELFLPNRESLIVNAATMSTIENLIVANSMEKIRVGERIFAAREVKSVRPIWPPEYRQLRDDNTYALTEDQRQDNLQRLTVIKQWFFERKSGEEMPN